MLVHPQRAFAVDGASEAVQHAAEQALAGGNPQRCSLRPDDVAGLDADQPAERHAPQAVPGGRHDFRVDARVLADGEQVADGAVQAFHGGTQSDDGRDDADPLGACRSDRGGEVGGARAPGGGHLFTQREFRALQRGADPRVEEAVGELRDRIPTVQLRVGHEGDVLVREHLVGKQRQVIRIHAHQRHDGGDRLRRDPRQRGARGGLLVAQLVSDDGLGEFEGGGDEDVLGVGDDGKRDGIQRPGRRRQHRDRLLDVRLTRLLETVVVGSEPRPQRLGVVGGGTQPGGVAGSVPAGLAAGSVRSLPAGEKGWVLGE